MNYPIRDGGSVTTWGAYEGEQIWRARRGANIAYFSAPRDSDTAWLMSMACAVLGDVLDPEGNTIAILAAGRPLELLAPLDHHNTDNP